jgi:hypothetical protein
LGRAPRHGPQFGEPGREHQHEGDALANALPDGGQRVAHQHDGKVDVARHVMHGPAGRRPGHLVLRRVNRDDLAAGRLHPVPQEHELGPLLAAPSVGDPDQDHAPRLDERFPVDVPQGGGSAEQVS